MRISDWSSDVCSSDLSRGPATDLKRNRLTSSCMQKGHLTLPSSLQVNKTYRRSANPAGARENGTAPPARPGSRRWQEDRQLAKRAAPGIPKETAALRRRWKASPDPRPLLNPASTIGSSSGRERVGKYV